MSDTITYTIYNTIHGQIVSIQSKAPNQRVDIDIDQAYLIGQIDFKSMYIDITQNPPIPVYKQQFNISFDKTTLSADNVDVITISNVPNGTQCTISSSGIYYSSNTITDGEIVFSTNNQGVYSITFQHPQYVEIINTITAT